MIMMMLLLLMMMIIFPVFPSKHYYFWYYKNITNVKTYRYRQAFKKIPYTPITAFFPRFFTNINNIPHFYCFSCFFCNLSPTAFRLGVPISEHGLLAIGCPILAEWELEHRSNIVPTSFQHHSTSFQRRSNIVEHRSNTVPTSLTKKITKSNIIPTSFHNRSNVPTSFQHD